MTMTEIKHWTMVKEQLCEFHGQGVTAAAILVVQSCSTKNESKTANTAQKYSFANLIDLIFCELLF
jgi:hypothetical protein